MLNYFNIKMICLQFIYEANILNNNFNYIFNNIYITELKQFQKFFL